MHRQDRQTRNSADSASELQFQHLASTFSAEWVEREHFPESLESPRKSKPRLRKSPQFSELEEIEGEKRVRGCVLAAELIRTRGVKRRVRRRMEEKGIHSFCFDIAPWIHFGYWFAAWYSSPTRLWKASSTAKSLVQSIPTDPYVGLNWNWATWDPKS